MTGKELKNLRERLQYTRKAFAKKIGIDNSDLGKYEKEKLTLTEKMERKILICLGFKSERRRTADLEVHIDYLKLTFFHTNVKEVIKKILCMDENHFYTEESKLNNYKYKHTCGEIVLRSGDAEQGVLMDLTSGGVCDLTRTLTSNGLTLQSWLKRVFSYDFVDDDGRALYNRVHSTRVDLAIDEMYDKQNGNFDLRELKEKVKKGDWYSTLKKYTAIDQLKESDNNGLTLYFGSRGNDRIFIRMYEKRYELMNKHKYCMEDILRDYKVYNRYELELGKEINEDIFRYWLFEGEALEQLAINLLLSKIEFYEEGTAGLFDRQAYTKWYEMFGEWERISLKVVSEQINLERSMRWIELQVSRTLKVIANIKGTDWLIAWILYLIDKTELDVRQEKRLRLEKAIADKSDNSEIFWFDEELKRKKEEYYEKAKQTLTESIR